MGILRIVHGVIVVLRHGLLEVEVHLRRDILRAEIPARRVNADVLTELTDSDGIARALGHLDLDAVLDHTHHLDKVDGERSLRIAQRSQRRLHTRHIGMVIRAPEVYQLFISALTLVNVVCDIRREV